MCYEFDKDTDTTCDKLLIILLKYLAFNFELNVNQNCAKMTFMIFGSETEVDQNWTKTEIFETENSDVNHIKKVIYHEI